MAVLREQQGPAPCAQQPRLPADAPQDECIFRGKTAMMPPAGCVFVANAMLGPLQLQAHGVADACGLLGADKYGQDKFCELQQSQAQPASLFAPRAPALRALDSVPRVPMTGFTVVQQIGSGAFGKVVLAHTATGAPVAIKTAAPGKESTLAQEALVHAELCHPHIVALRAVIPPPPPPPPLAAPAAAVGGLVLDFCGGGTLAEALEGRAGAPLPYELRLAVLEQVLAALEHMHARGLCHLDIKPCNVMLQTARLEDAQTLRLADFGLSQAADGALMPGRYRGTLPYMAPELAVNLRSVAAPALDVWSVGVLMRELVTLAPPCASWRGGAI